MASFIVCVSEDAKNDIQSIPQFKEEDLNELLRTKLEENPCRGAKRLQGPLKKFYSQRIWQIRTVFKVNRKRGIVEIFGIANRDNVYIKILNRISRLN